VAEENKYKKGPLVCQKQLRKKKKTFFFVEVAIDNNNNNKGEKKLNIMRYGNS
jgi:hypothetical protein